MNKKTLQLTTGAMVLAIFGILLLFNRQTAGALEELFFYIFPIPMVAYSAKNGWKVSLPLFAAMVLMSAFLGTFTTIFYAASQAGVGLVLGTCLNKKIDSTKTVFSVMVLTAVVNVLNTIVLASLFGIDLEAEITEMENMMNAVFEASGVVLPTELVSRNYLMQMLVISVIVLGIVQGYLVYVLSLVLLKRLRFNVPKPRSVYLYFPPKWLGIAALLLYFVYYVSLLKPFENQMLQHAISSGGMCGYTFLVIFGYIGILFYVKVKTRLPKLVGVIIATFLMFVLSPFLIVCGAYYVIGSIHQELIKEYSQNHGTAN